MENLTDFTVSEPQGEDGGLSRQPPSGRFELPGALYGREAEIAELAAAYERVSASGAPELVLLSGDSGSGKTSVVRELYPLLLRQRAAYGEGKVDQQQRGAPYAALAEAFDGLLERLLTEREASVVAWRRRLRTALGPNGRLVADVVAALAPLLGELPPLPEVEPADRLQRFQYAFWRFLTVLAGPEHPVVIFLDDLQWLDASSLKLLQHLLTHPDTTHLLVIGACRSEEVGGAHPLVRAVRAIQAAGVRAGELSLRPLGADALARLIAELTQAAPEAVAPLVELVREKTGGNAFFARQFLAELHREELLRFDPEAGRWRWELAKIQAKGSTDNVIDLLVRKLRRLAPATQRVLQLAAACGGGVDAHALAVLAAGSVDETRLALGEAEREGLLQREGGACRFAHDRVQQAAYSLLPEAERPAVHLGIGRMLLEATPPEALETRLFEIVDQFGRAGDLLAAPEERARLAELNLSAGRKAMASAAYAEAITYLEAGAALLAPDAWESRYETSFALRLCLAESRLLHGDVDDAGRLLEALAPRVRGRIDAAAVAAQRIALLTQAGRYGEAIALGAEFLGSFDLALTPQPSRALLEAEYRALRSALGDRPIAGLADLPEMADPETRAVFDVLTALLPPAYLSDPTASCLIALRMATFSCRHGNTPGSAFGYAWLGGMLGSYLGDYVTGDQFGQLAWDMIEGRGLIGLEAKIPIVVRSIVTPWTRSLGDSLGALRRGHAAALQARDVFYACSASHVIVTHRLALGDPLAEVERELEAHLSVVRKAGITLIERIMIGQERLVRSLRGLTTRFGAYDDAEFDTAGYEAFLAESGAPFALAASWYAVRKTMACYMAGDYEEALRAAAAAEPLLEASPGFLELALARFYAALSLAARAGAEPEPEAVAALRNDRERLRAWAETCPENFGAPAALLGAELARLTGRPLEAERFYEEAIAAARQNGLVHLEGLGFELASRHYRQRGAVETETAHLRQARACYARWGADGKVRQLEAHHPELREERSP